MKDLTIKRIHLHAHIPTCRAYQALRVSVFFLLFFYRGTYLGPQGFEGGLFAAV
jgi:hypothetical protein